jgi:hypothetical protein
LASLRDRLIGAWRLAEFTVTAEDGTVTYPMGEDVEGLIIYTPDGYMSAQLMEPGRPAYASGEFTHGRRLPRLPGTSPTPVPSMSMSRPRP